MKTTIHSRFSMLFAAFSLFFIAPLSAVAQDAKDLNVDVDINSGGDAGFFTQPWVWIVGGAVFILLLVALLRGRGGRAD